MPKNIMITGATITGKTTVVIALAARIRSAGNTVGYFKPIGERSFADSHPSAGIDADAILMKDVLQMRAGLNCICPIIHSPMSYDEMLRVGHGPLAKRIQGCYSEVSEGMDYMLIESTPVPWDLLHVGLSAPQVAEELDARVICLVTFPDVSALDDVLLHRDFFRHYGVESIGVILFMVPPMLKSIVKDEIGLKLKDFGVDFCGAVYQNRELFGPTLRDIVRALEAQMIVGEKESEMSIGEFMVGSMEPENALKWFRRVADKAVITSGDRPDLCLAALETDTKLLILTGGLGPDIQTVAKAIELGVPIMMTEKDTYTTSQIVDHLIGTITPDNKEKIAAAERIIGESLDFSAIGIE
jgi:BioD-like phosphotransacetylase family protein